MKPQYQRLGGGWIGEAALDGSTTRARQQVRSIGLLTKHRKGHDIVSVTNIGEAKRRRARVCEVVDWVVEKVPWTIAIADWPGFSEQWSALTAAELAEVELELHIRGEALCAEDPDLEALAATITGRPKRWTAAADWLSRHIGRDMTDEEFCRLFGTLSRGELILAAVEHRRRLLTRLAI